MASRQKINRSKVARTYLTNKNLNPIKIQVGYNPYKSEFKELKNCIVFPLKDKNGNIISMYGRSLTDKKGSKHYYLKNRKGLYPAYPKPETKTLIITEAIIDAATIMTHTEHKVLSMFGTNGWNEEHNEVIKSLGMVTTNSEKVATFIGKTTETQSLKNLFGDFKHIEVGETIGSVNLLNMPDTYWNPTTWFKDYNKDWMLRAINRGDDIYITSRIDINSLYNLKNDGVTRYGSYFANELNELVEAGVKPKNLTQIEWDNLVNEIVQAAATKF